MKSERMRLCVCATKIARQSSKSFVSFDFGVFFLVSLSTDGCLAWDHIISVLLKAHFISASFMSCGKFLSVDIT